MAGHLLHGTYASAGFQQVSHKRAPQTMRGKVLDPRCQFPGLQDRHEKGTGPVAPDGKPARQKLRAARRGIHLPRFVAFGAPQDFL